MNLPIDYRNAPLKTKYVDEETPMFAQWFEIGEYPDGSVGITDGTVDVMTHVPPEVAARIIEARHVFCAAIIAELGMAFGAKS